MLPLKARCCSSGWIDLSVLCAKTSFRSLVSTDATEIVLKSPGFWGVALLGMKIVFEIERFSGSFPHQKMTPENDHNSDYVKRCGGLELAGCRWDPSRMVLMQRDWYTVLCCCVSAYSRLLASLRLIQIRKQSIGPSGGW